MAVELRFSGLNFRDARFQIGLLASLGLIDAIYLTFIKFANNRAFCLQGVGDCYGVNTSVYSEIHGIPISILGAGAYLTILVLLYLERKSEFFESNTSIIIFGVTLVGVLYSLYLTYIEVAVLRAICPFCVISATVMILLFIISTARLLKGSGENQLRQEES
jgi:uncharacterized membrane protein